MNTEIRRAKHQRTGVSVNANKGSREGEASGGRGEENKGQYSCSEEQGEACVKGWAEESKS